MAKQASKKRDRKIRQLNPNAAGIDIGSQKHYVAVPTDCDNAPVRSFGCLTPDLHQMAKWLKSCGIETIAMESTGVYWVPVVAVLERYGFDVKLVDAYKVKNVPGRKTDVQDCQWIGELHRFGLLSGAFRPDKQIRVLRSYWRHRSTLVEACSTQIHLMQKSLEQMNIQLHKVIAEITGVTGMKIIRAIVAGERNAVKLVTGGKVRKRRTGKVQNRAARALRLAAQSLHSSKSSLGAFYRRMRARLGAPKAITATAHKLAKLVYRMLKHGMDYVDRGQQYYENQYRERVIANLATRARKIGYAVVCTNTGELVS